MSDEFVRFASVIFLAGLCWWCVAYENWGPAAFNALHAFYWMTRPRSPAA